MGDAPTSSALATGAVVGGRFIVVRKLGHGGIGAVYEVKHRHTKHRRALKVLLEEHRDEPEVVERFLTEASAAGHIGNPHIVETVDTGQLQDGSPFIVMEYLEGKVLADILDRNVRLDVGLTIALLLQVCDGVQAAHDAGIIHRDLKPENLFLTNKDGHAFVKILDFGISKFLPGLDGDDRKLTAAGISMGTPQYMAPEQWLDAKRVDGRADVYSLGVIAYQILSGALPYTEGLGAVLKGHHTPLHERDRAIPKALSEVVAKAMNSDREARFASVAELNRALRPFGNDRTASILLVHEIVGIDASPGRQNGDTHSSADGQTTDPMATGVDPRAIEPARGRPTPRRLWRRAAPAAIIIASLLAGVAITFTLMESKSGPPGETPLSISPAFQPAARAIAPTADSHLKAVAPDEAPDAGVHMVPAVASDARPAAKSPDKAITFRLDDPKERPAASTKPQTPASPVVEPKPTANPSGCLDGMRLVQSGSFKMGTARDDPMMGFDEKPLGTVDVEAFCMDTFEYPNRAGATPVINVSHADAQRLCLGKGKRLCTEEEWEKACKGAGNARWPYGNTFDANACNTGDELGDSRALAPSGRFSKCRSGYGIADMSGNASEWTADKTVKGGSYSAFDSKARCSARSTGASIGRSSEIGFRCCLTQKPAE